MQIPENDIIRNMEMWGEPYARKRPAVRERPEMKDMKEYIRGSYLEEFLDYIAAVEPGLVENYVDNELEEFYRWFSD